MHSASGANDNMTTHYDEELNEGVICHIIMHYENRTRCKMCHIVRLVVSERFADPVTTLVQYSYGASLCQEGLARPLSFQREPT